MRFACGDMRDHILSCQNGHRPSYWRQRALRQQERLSIDFREILRVVRFSTFATISVKLGSVPACTGRPLYPEEQTSSGRPGMIRFVPKTGRGALRQFRRRCYLPMIPLICTIAELIRCSLTRIDTDSDLIIRVLRAIALTVRQVRSPSALVAVNASAFLDLARQPECS
jgi:hypothetical protein